MRDSLNSVNTPEELLQAYTTMFILLGSSVSDTPETGGLPSFCERGLLRNLPVESNNAIFRDASHLLMSPCPFHQQCHLKVRDNYDSLFSKMKKVMTRPLASYWTGDTDEEEVLRRILGFYQKYDFRKSEKCELEYDHLGIELLFVNLLIEKYLTEDEVSRQELIRRDLLSFITGEMLTWVPQWSRAVTEASATKCYTGIAGLVHGSLQDVSEIIRLR